MILPWAVCCLMLCACSSELDPTQPDDAYLLFRDALWKDDAQGAWKLTDEATKQFFEAQHQELIAMNEAIERYLPQADHRIAKRQSGAVLLKSTKDGFELFEAIFQMPKIEKNEALRLGSEVDEVQLTEDEKNAKIITRAGQPFYLTRPKDEGPWSVALLKSAPLDKTMGWVDQNRTALSQTVDDLIAEEQTKREAIIAELLGKK